MVRVMIVFLYFFSLSGCSDNEKPDLKPYIVNPYGYHVYGRWVWVHESAEDARKKRPKVAKFIGDDGEYYNADGSVWLDPYHDKPASDFKPDRSTGDPRSDNKNSKNKQK